MQLQNGKYTALHFFGTHPVFRSEEFVNFVSGEKKKSRQTYYNLLAYHISTGRLVRVRRGLYATVLRGLSPEQAAVDGYLVATKLADDAVVAYHAALQFYGKSYSVSQRYTYLTRQRARTFHFRQAQFVPIQVPAVLRDVSDVGGGIVERNHAGGLVRVTTLERTLVDVLDAPNHGGGWEEVWRSLETIEFFDLDAVVAYTLKLSSALTAARVGFFLEQHRDALLVEERHLEALRSHKPAHPSYLDRRRESGKFIPQWNLVVPQKVLSKAWSEPT